MTKEENKALCEKFPFLIPRSVWTGEIISGYDYEVTELDFMPDGWRKAFGIQLCEELKTALDKVDTSEIWFPTQIKEKYGELRWYANWYTKEIEEILDKYSKLSRKTCIVCGKPATKISTGWISPYCDDCANNQYEEYIPIDEAYSMYIDFP